MHNCVPFLNIKICPNLHNVILLPRKIDLLTTLPISRSTHHTRAHARTHTHTFSLSLWMDIIQRNRSLLACSNSTRHVYRYTMHKYNFERVSAPFVAVVMAILIFRSFSRVWSKNFHFYDIRMKLALQWQTESSETLLFARNFTNRKKKTLTRKQITHRTTISSCANYTIYA